MFARKMLEFTQFQKSYNDARAYFNIHMRGISVSSDIEPVDTFGLSVVTLAAVAIMLVHNSKNNHPSGLNIDTLATYDLNNFTDWKMFDPYVDYLVFKRYGNTDKARTEEFFAGYNALMVRYLHIAQQVGIRLLE